MCHHRYLWRNGVVPFDQIARRIYTSCHLSRKPCGSLSRLAALPQNKRFFNVTYIVETLEKNESLLELEPWMKRSQRVFPGFLRYPIPDPPSLYNYSSFSSSIVLSLIVFKVLKCTYNRAIVSYDFNKIKKSSETCKRPE